MNAITRRLAFPVAILVALTLTVGLASLLGGCAWHDPPPPMAQVEPPPARPPAPTVQVNIRATERSVVVLGNMGDAVKLGDEQHTLTPKPDPPAGPGAATPAEGGGKAP